MSDSGISKFFSVSDKLPWTNPVEDDDNFSMRYDPDKKCLVVKHMRAGEVLEEQDARFD